MKYIPLESFESINSLLQSVEALGCLVTIRLEAYTCRHTREERQIATNLARYFTNVQSTPPLSPSPLMVGPNATFQAGGGPVVELLPPPMVLGSAVATEGQHSAVAVAGGGSSPYVNEGSANTSRSPGATSGTPLVTAQDIDERLVFMVAALNSMYEKDGYDFSVLTERDFLEHTPDALRDEVNLVLRQLPEETCGPAVRQFWPAIDEQVGSTAGDGCEVFEFNCPACDPRAEVSLFSKQYFLYSKPGKILVSLLVYGEGNQYRGDDYYTHGGRPPHAHSPGPDHPRREDEEEEGEEGSGKNRGFYGYY